MILGSEQSRKDYLELLEELKNVLLNLKENPANIIQQSEYEEIIKGFIQDFKRPSSFNNPFQIEDMVRIVHYPYQKIPMSTRGSEISSGRYHHVSTGPRCIYLSSTEETSLVETKMKNNSDLLNKVIKSPKSTFYFSGKLQNVLDLRTQKNAEENGIHFELIFDDWQDLNILYSLKSYTQSIARRAFEFGYEGVIYQSTKHQEGWNLVVFSENMLIDSYLSVQGSVFTLQDIDPTQRNLYGYLPNISG